MGKPKLSEQSQLNRFKEAARELECDEDEETFKRALHKVVKAPVEKKPK